MTLDNDEQLASLGEPENTLRQRLRDDPSTQQIAASLGVDIEDYITQVIFYARRPNLPPQVEILPDEELAELEGELPSEGEVTQWLEAVARGDIDLSEPEVGMAQKSAYTTEVDRSEQLRAVAMGGSLERQAPAIEVPRSRSENRPASILEQQLQQQQRLARHRVEARRGPGTPAEKKA